MKEYKRILRVIWILSILIALLVYGIWFDQITALSIRELFHANIGLIWVLYAVMSMIRALFFVPSTPFVLLGALLFPQKVIAVFLVSLIGVGIGATLLYFLSGYLVTELLENKHKEKVKWIKPKIERFGFSIIVLWSFFPLVPTDLICGLCGVLRYSYLKFITAIIIGESILIGFYLWGAKFFEGVI